MEFSIRNCYLRPGFTDLRNGMNGLMRVAMSEMELDPLGGDLFLFCGRDRHTVKMLWWSGDGFWLLQKRLNNLTFAWPKSGLEALEISETQLSMLLQGIDFWRSHPVLLAEKTC
ncbi:transposase [Sphaerochaeta pleomorpha str. Grapes]|uniref:Transposase n=1 Tax=Sphaerochaeta pleomorpha (strain ATCC BAA-1885 / DSM 22778 / Grapes) TaxID=158190 RepID=G8QWF1_SPHPG|nr:IS66 family insertion sequence element accessory protein TnpB [Sphaerochaeta pleomorpha]AEV29446.1 transposase [Sphaerochaeta pleomorpha str. Grapes]AEV29449.1 transposase [Sphaerochaeta pleomorpha str. Grapes]